MGEAGLHLLRNARVHHPEPQGGSQAEQDGGRIAEGQRRALLVAVQHLVLLGGLVVVVTVPGQFVQRDAANVEVGIPRMVRADDFVAAGSRLEPAQSVVLDVVDALEEEEGDHPHRHGKE